MEEDDRKRAATTFSFFKVVDKNLVPFRVITLAEQLFGFVEDKKGQGKRAAKALAGRVRFSHGRLCNKKELDAQIYLPSLTLRILDSPKPPCPALYFKTAQGKPHYVSKKELKPRQHHPQGRKLYLHHRSQDGPEPWRTSNPNEQCTQKVEITPIRQGAEFYFHADFDNLSPVELGLLFLALRPNDEFRHKLGMGKSIGLGKIEIAPVGVFCVERRSRYTADGLFGPRYHRSWVHQNEDIQRWPQDYDRERQAAKAGGIDLQELRRSFFEKMDLDIRTALDLLGRPDRLRGPVHTPTVEGQLAEEETFRWFVENDSREKKFLEPLSKQSVHLPTLPELSEE